MASGEPKVGEIWTKRKGRKARYEVETYNSEFVCAVNRQPSGVCYAWQGTMSDFLRDFEKVEATNAS